MYFQKDEFLYIEEDSEYDDEILKKLIDKWMIDDLGICIIVLGVVCVIFLLISVILVIVGVSMFYWYDMVGIYSFGLFQRCDLLFFICEYIDIFLLIVFLDSKWDLWE